MTKAEREKEKLEGMLKGFGHICRHQEQYWSHTPF